MVLWMMVRTYCDSSSHSNWCLFLDVWTKFATCTQQVRLLVAFCNDSLNFVSLSLDLSLYLSVTRSRHKTICFTNTLCRLFLDSFSCLSHSFLRANSTVRSYFDNDVCDVNGQEASSRAPFDSSLPISTVELMMMLMFLPTSASHRETTSGSTHRSLRQQERRQDFPCVYAKKMLHADWVLAVACVRQKYAALWLDWRARVCTSKICCVPIGALVCVRQIFSVFRLDIGTIAVCTQYYYCVIIGQSAKRLENRYMG